MRNCSYGDICCAYAYPSAGGRFVRFCMTQSDIDWNLDPTNGVYSEDKGVTQFVGIECDKSLIIEDPFASENKSTLLLATIGTLGLSLASSTLY